MLRALVVQSELHGPASLAPLTRSGVSQWSLARWSLVEAVDLSGAAVSCEDEASRPRSIQGGGQGWSRKGGSDEKHGKDSGEDAMSSNEIHVPDLGNGQPYDGPLKTQLGWGGGIAEGPSRERSGTRSCRQTPHGPTWPSSR